MTTPERIAYLSSVWKNICNVFPYFDKLEFDLGHVYEEYIDRVINASSDRDYCLLLAEFVNQFGDGHTDFSFPIQMREETGFLPFTLSFIDGEYYINAVEPGKEQFLWAKVESVNGESFHDLLNRAFRYIYHVDRYAYPSKLHAILPFMLLSFGNHMKTSQGDYSFDLLSNRPVFLKPDSLDAGIPFAHLDSEKTEVRLYDGNILYVNIPTLTNSDASHDIKTALDQNCSIKGVILDLRENEGGMTANGAQIAELFLSGLFSGCRKHTRIIRGIDVSSASQYARMSDETIERYIVSGLCDREEVERCRKVNSNTLVEEYCDSFGSEDHVAAYSGPCVILTSRNTISAAEDLIAMFRSNNRALLVGLPTHGSTGTPVMLPLSIGGGTRICSVGYRLFDGTEFIGSGIVPDFLVENSIDDYRRGFDRVLRKALDLLTE